VPLLEVLQVSVLIVSLDVVLTASDLRTLRYQSTDTLCMVPMRAEKRYSSMAYPLLRMPCPVLTGMYGAVESLFERHWPVLAWHTGIDVYRIDRQQVYLDQALLTALLVTELIHRYLKIEELGMRNLMYRRPVDDVQKEFTNLADFRRALGRPYTAMRYLQHFISYEDLFKGGVPWSPPSYEKDAAPIAADQASLKQPIDLKEFLLGKLGDLEKRLDAMKEDINDEIQVAIGAVQVQDAQFMKQQTQETVRQTRLTVVLAILAAIYLPMTLVTGIFGMNIKEISSDKTATYAWQVGVAWLVIFAFTALGGGAAYVWSEKWKAKKEQGKSKKESDLEANDMDDESGIKQRGKTSKSSSKGTRRWGQKAKQKTKTTRTAKRE
jgi:hypothetical protein